jgi:hypothetical protein
MDKIRISLDFTNKYFEVSLGGEGKWPGFDGGKWLAERFRKKAVGI